MTTENRSNMSLEAMDRGGLVHPNTDLRAFAHGELGDPHIIQAGSGIHVRDQSGRDYIDAFAGLWCVNVGYGRTEIADDFRRRCPRGCSAARFF